MTLPHLLRALRWVLDRIPRYSKRRRDLDWLDGFFRGIKLVKSELGIERDARGRFRKITKT